MSQKRFSFNDGINFLEEGWDKFLFSGSSNGFLMTRPKGKSNLQMYNEASEAWNKKRAEYVDLQNKETKTAIKMKEAMDKLLEKKKKYENIKHIPHLSDTCKTHISDLYTVYTTGRTEDIISKYMDKGIMIEEDIITNYAILKRSMFKKNTVRKKNDFVEGEMDFEDPDEDMIIDAKGNWTIFQFNRVKAKPIKPLYHWQLDTYMWLWNKSKARLVYGLVNTPQKLIEMEKKKLLYTFTGTDEEYNQACEEIQYLHTYDDIPLERKIKTFDIKRDDTRIDMLKQTINDCRYYLNNFEQANTFDEDKTNEDETED